jgi:Fe-S-cluster-containing dehydrogenase component
MNFGFLIDNTSCIGCHACSTACKSENEVPIGVHRTWVKYTETGTLPDVSRQFQVTRCNHCANPPCVAICPTAAMYQRPDGIVEFDSDACIGCKGCMQACPYDAIHLDPDNHTAAKCHMCSHRIDVGLEPACVVVCPVQAISVGDLDDPTSSIAQKRAQHDVAVRKPEQGTQPNLFYIDPAPHLSDIMVPGDMHAFGDVAHDHGQNVRIAEQMVQVGFNAQHATHWHWPIPAYLITKYIAGGSFLFLAATVHGLTAFSPVAMVYGGGLAVLMTFVTLALLLYDLDRPDRFIYLLTRPQWRSWVARAAWILTGFSILSTGWYAAELLTYWGLADLSAFRLLLSLLTAPFAAMAALYTAFLLGQAEGRDLWQSWHVLPQMIAQTGVFATAPFLAIDALVGLPPHLTLIATAGMALSLIWSLGITLVADLAFTHSTDVARLGQRLLTRRPAFWVGIVVGHVLPLAFLAMESAPLSLLAALCAALGSFSYAHAFIMAPQQVPNS